MTYKNYAVVVMPKDEKDMYNPVYDDEYDKAFDGFNAAITDAGGTQLFRQPRGEQPLRAVTKDYMIELWIITRTDELIKTKE